MPRLAAVLALLLCGLPAQGQLLIVGGGSLGEDLIATFRAAAGDADARLVVIPSASAAADRPDARDRDLARWRERGFDAVAWLHTRDRAVADDAAFVAPLWTATAVWIGGGDQRRLTSAYVGTAVETALHDVLARGGVVAGSSAGAAIASRTMIRGGRERALLGTGFGLLAGAIIDQHFTARGRLGRLVDATARRPDQVGLGLDESTALLVSGRAARVLGAGAVTVVLAAAAERPPWIEAIAAGGSLDLEQLRRAARWRASGTTPAGAFDPRTLRPRPPRSGTLILGGGGDLGAAAPAAFVAAAGGAHAPLIVVPTAAGDAHERAARFAVASLQAAGARDVAVFHEPDRRALQASSRLAPLRRARGVWFTGGRQWRLVDAYGGTPAELAFAAVLARGGVLGGSSAGATILGDYLVRGHPLGNRVMMAEGYERGFGGLPGVAVDQHFRERRREQDLVAVVERFPNLVGLGIDEGTFLIARGARAEVRGRGGVTRIVAAPDGALHARFWPAGSALPLHGAPAAPADTGGDGAGRPDR